VPSSTSQQIKLESEAVKKRSLGDSLNVAGEILPEFGKEVSLTNRVRGRVVQIFVKPGDSVTQGQTLALIDSQQISDLQSQLIEANSKLDIAKAHEEREKQVYNEQVQRPEALLEAKERFEEAKVQLQLSKQNMERYDRLLEEGIAASKDFYASQAKYNRARSLHRQAKADMEREQGLYKNKAMLRRDLQLAQAEVRRAKQRVSTLKQRLIFLGMTESNVNQIITSGKIEGTVPIISSMSGTVSDQNVALGEIVDPGKEAFRISDLSTVSLSAEIPAADLPSLGLGMPVVARISGLPGQVFKGKINYIGSHIDPETRTAPIRAQLDNKDAKLKASMYADTRIELPPRMVLACPKQSVQKKKGRSVVYVADDEKFIEQPVRLGRDNEKYYEVITGLNEGDRVVTTGSLLLKTEVASGSPGATVISGRGNLTR
jgi:RND family efflux transporter MFP subunit